jgi:hypothetical protein
VALQLSVNKATKGKMNFTTDYSDYSDEYMEFENAGISNLEVIGLLHSATALVIERFETTELTVFV